MANKTPILVTGTFTPSGTTNVAIIASIPLTVLQGTSPWVISGTVAVSNFPAIQPVSGTITALQGTSPWVVSGTISTSPDVNVHDGTGVSISSTGSSLNVAVTNTVPISGTITANQGTSPWIISGAVSATQSGAWTTGRTWTLASGTDSVSAVQSGAWTVAATQSGTWNINNISGTISLPTGAATEATLLAAKVDLDKFTFASTRLLVDGSGVVQPVSGTVAVTQSTSPWVVSGTITPAVVSTSVVTRVASATTNHTLLAANAARKGILFYNDGTAQQFIKFGTTATTSDFTIRITSQSFYEVAQPIYTGQIDVISSSTNGAIQVTELS